MAIKIRHIDKWNRLEAGDHIKLPGRKVRTIKLEVNCPRETRFDVLEYDEYGDMVYGTFVANIKGREVLEFTVAGDITVLPTIDDVAAEVWWHSPDGDNIAQVIDGEETFTELVTRTARDPVMERYMYMQQLNFERRLDAMQRDTAAQIASMGTTFNVRTGEPTNGENGSGNAGGNESQQQQQPTGESAAEAEGQEPTAPAPKPGPKSGSK